jgi:hypothetical protein
MKAVGLAGKCEAYYVLEQGKRYGDVGNGPSIEGSGVALDTKGR